MQLDLNDEEDRLLAALAGLGSMALGWAQAKAANLPVSDAMEAGIQVRSAELLAAFDHAKVKKVLETLVGAIIQNSGRRN